MLTLLPHPPAAAGGELRYRISAREKRAFHTVLDAHTLLAGHEVRESVVRIDPSGGALRMDLRHPIAGGWIHEHLTCASSSTRRLVSETFGREVLGPAGERVRFEDVDFRYSELGLPRELYPEVALPWALGWLPFDKSRRSLYAWINDRFVARVYVETTRGGHKVVKLDLPIGRRPAIEVLMYPDLNDWVPLPSLLTRLAKPFVPKYHMWYEPDPPHRLLRFEGPYGPPGAPEIVLELAGLGPLEGS